MSDITKNKFTKEQLFACLEHDGVEVDASTMNKAKNNVGQALRVIGHVYHFQIKNYSKAMAWYRLAANQNNSDAYNEIGVLYNDGKGVSRDFLTAMDCYLKAAGNENKTAMGNIASYFLYGAGVPVDKYKALEWYIKSGEKPEEIKKLNKKDVHLKEEDKNKTIHQLINETEEIRIVKRARGEYDLKRKESEIQALMKVKTSNEKEIQKLRMESQQNQQRMNSFEQEKQKIINEERLSKQLNISLEKQLNDKMETINSLNIAIKSLSSLIQSKDNEIDSLIMISRLEREEFKRKMEKYEQGAQVPTSTTDNNNNDSTASNTVDSNSNLDNHESHSDIPSISVADIIVKMEPGYEDNISIPHQNGNKRRRVPFNGT